jgi:hypothetical protein
MQQQRTNYGEVSHKAEHSRQMPVGGFQVTWDTFYKKLRYDANKNVKVEVLTFET